MNNLLKKILAVSLSIVMMLSLPVIAMAERIPSDTGGGLIFVEGMLADAEFSNSVIEYLHASYGEQFFINQEIASATADLIYDTFPVSGRGAEEVVMYPPSFCGMYIDYDGNLVVLTVENAVESMAARSAAASAYSALAVEGGANIRSVEFAYSELRNAFLSIPNFISEYYAEENLANRGCPIIYNIDGAGIDIIANRVTVWLLDTSAQQLELFREKIVDHPALVFVQVSERTTLGKREINTVYNNEEFGFDGELTAFFDDIAVDVWIDESANAQGVSSLEDEVTVDVWVDENFNAREAFFMEDEVAVDVWVDESFNARETFSLEEVVVVDV